MTQSTPERMKCSVCPGEYTVTRDGKVRHHSTDNPEFQAGPDSKRCKGAGEPPATAAGVALAEDMESGDPQCRLCKHPVQLTGNGRVRSHLTPEATPRQCPAGSDFPLGAYPEIVGTTDGLVATLARDCEHREIGECYDCYAARGAERCPDHGDPIECTCQAKAGQAQMAAEKQLTMADRLRAVETDDFGRPVRECFNCDALGCTGCGEPAADDGRSEASRFTELLKRETRGAGTVLDRIDPVVLQDGRTKSGGVYCEQCDTDNHRCPGCGTDVPHGTVACTPCHREALAGRLPRGTTEDGRPCHHHEALFGMEGDLLVCVACGTPCTHPDGFTDNDPVEDDGEGLVFRCELCGSVDSGDELPGRCTCDSEDHTHDGGCPAAVGPDPELPNCPHPMTHRAGCGCPDDDSTEPKDPGLLVEQVRVRELDEGDTFIRRGTRMRLTGRESATVVLAEVLDGPYKGRTGELKNPDEIVERDRPEEDRATEALGKCTRCGEPRDGHAHDVLESDGGWRTPGDLLAKMSEEIRGMDALRFNCAECKHPITPIIDQFSLDGRAAVVTWACEPHITSSYQKCKDHECRPDVLVSIGDLEFGDHFVRRGVLMRCTSSGYGLVEAVVVEGPMKGRTGELKNPAEQVERTYCRHNFSEPDGDGGLNCKYCGDLKTTTEQETTECKQDTEARTSPRSSSAQERPATTGPGQAPGSKPPTPASAPAASKSSSPATSSAPTAKASTNGRSAVATTDQNAAAAAFLGNGRPAALATTGSANQADAAAQFLAGGSGAHGEAETKRDRFGRYLIPHPDTGKEQAWTRSTTFAKSISDTYALGQWGLRMALLGATMRPDIVQRAHGKHVKADKPLLDELTAELKNAAGDKVAANLGTSMHSFTEMADRAWHSPGGPRSVLDQIPPDCRDMVATYIRLLEETGLEPVPHLIEFTTVVKQYGVAGTSDNCYKVTKPLKLKIGRAEVHLSPGEYVIGDKKTGKDLDYGWQEIVIQLATYAQGINTAGVWDRKEEVWEPDPLSRFDKPGTKVRLDAGIVVHLPVDRESEKQPAVYGVDLESGWNAAVLCERVRAWRKVRYLASPVMVSEEGTTFVPAPSTPGVTSRPKPAVVTQTTVRPPSLMDKARSVTSKSEASAVWKEAREAGKSDAEVDKLVATMQARLRELAEPGG